MVVSNVTRIGETVDWSGLVIASSIKVKTQKSLSKPKTKNLHCVGKASNGDHVK